MIWATRPLQSVMKDKSIPAYVGVAGIGFCHHARHACLLTAISGLLASGALATAQNAVTAPAGSPSNAAVTPQQALSKEAPQPAVTRMSPQTAFPGGVPASAINQSQPNGFPGGSPNMPAHVTPAATNTAVTNSIDNLSNTNRAVAPSSVGGAARTAAPSPVNSNPPGFIEGAPPLQGAGGSPP